jgi:hypothetical protein
VSPPASASAAEATTVGLRWTASTPSGVLLRPPAGGSWAAYRWLEIDPPATGLPDDTWTLSDQPSASAQRQIVFRTLAGKAQPFRVYVGSCAQWHGYGAAPLYLSTHHPVGSFSARLVP